ncbi:MAG: nitroreductase family protein [Acidimicrobiales bacterium]
MELFEAIRTTRAMRRLDPDRPVPEEDLWTIVEAATKAPSGGNRQVARWMVVTDRERRAKIGALYGEAWNSVRTAYVEAQDDDAPSLILTSADYLAAHMGEAPAIIVPCSRAGDPASIYPGCQNLFLAARELGLGTALTTVHRLKEVEVKEVLDIPDDVQTWAMIPVGYPLGRWGEAQRRPVEETTYWDVYGERRDRSSR